MIKLLILGIRMDRGGTERALISFLQGLDPTVFQVDLLLAQQEGPLLPSIPAHVRLLPPMKNGILFTMSRRNAASVFRKLAFHGKRSFLIRHTALLSAIMRREVGASDRFFIALMKEACQLFSEEYHEESYDAALAFSGDRTMFYLCDRVCCQKKIAWLHFDYRYPERDDKLYGSYFQRCHVVLSVSDRCTVLLRHRFPTIANRFDTFYNRLPRREILTLSEVAYTDPDPSFAGYRLLSVMRICHQKGVDRIPPVLKRLKLAGISVKWYLAGDGSRKELNALRRAATRYGVENDLVILGGIENPYPLMKTCDLFVLPTRYEGMPITVEEAKLLGVPILCTSYLSAKEQLQNGFLGAICHGSVSSIASAIVTLLLREDLRRNFRKRLADYPWPERNITHELQYLLAYC